jgi:hypothetical protein
VYKLGTMRVPAAGLPISKPQLAIERHRAVFIARPALGFRRRTCPIGCTSHTARLSHVLTVAARPRPEGSGAPTSLNVPCTAADEPSARGQNL